MANTIFLSLPETEWKRPPPDTDCTAQLWAPELHSIDGRWYIYVAGAHPAQGNRSHRMYVLGGPPADTDPTAGTWENLGLIRGLPQQQWQIDGTVFSIDNRLFLVYSGWPFDNADLSDLVQELFIVPLSDPVTAAARQPVRISTPEHPWEWTADHGINEGPQWFESADGRWRGLVYSCAGSWTKDYKMATLQYTGGDPMDPRSWRKSNKPLIENAPGRGPYAPGHGMFMKLGEETVAVFHATDNDNDGWNGRKARVQRVKFTNEGPEMGGRVGLAGDADMFTGYGSLDRRHERRHSLRDLWGSVFSRVS
ncbi:hypothetical protein W97_07571 [Coniosporium apollinis CBS 100218]|uniref:Uncharacterized protein n=1 Tax=Coniosporium apollinis (strain CBS 100218) TaxID=1168221 RepID=R7Z2I4_CONA1|nr:uncharacterized protein W97_07571 [Coniosporium apollinis CBS 100218]EON68313.1 hypothetical protein W97_07571 [Coniosporium apollinis CBS 100218]